MSTFFSSGSKQEFTQFEIVYIVSLHSLNDDVEDNSILVTQSDVNFSGLFVVSNVEGRPWYIFVISNSYCVKTDLDYIHPRWSCFKWIKNSAFYEGRVKELYY